jgi:curved DNA-binding protein CbpA
MRDAYEILQVSPTAELEVIEAAYRRLAKKYHPDINPSYDADAKMKEFNWAYETLRDPLSRSKYDQDRRAKYVDPFAQNYNSGNTYTQPSSSSTTRVTPSNIPTEKRSQSITSFQKYLIGIGIIIALYYFIIRPSLINSTTSSNAPSGADSINTHNDPYKDCINWTSAYLYDGQRKCVIGRILAVDHQYDELSGSTMWTAHFSLNPASDFTLISVGNDISNWQGQCIVVYGTLFDRSTIKEYVQNAQPSMLDTSIIGSSSSFSIISAPSNKCP